jgi:transposase
LAELLAHGLIRASFVPDGQTQELRNLLRTRKQLVRERSRHTQRIHKVLEDANLKIDAELSDMLGKEWPGDPRRPGGRRDGSGPACRLGASQREVPANQAGFRRCGGA